MTLVTRISIAMARRGRHLRAGLAALALVLIAQSAAAADMGDMLRGSFGNGASASRWDGVHFGVQLGLTNMNADFANSTGPMVAFILRNTTIENENPPSNWTTLPSNVTNGRQYGAFLGYNFQWDQLVLGFDLAYNRMYSLESSASDSIERQFKTSDGYYNDVFVSGQASIKLIDYATIRARAGYAFGQFLPYAFVGGAVGRFNYTVSATVIASGTDVSGGGGAPYSLMQTLGNSKDGAIVGGVVAGLGMDVALLPNVFLRGEWEYIAFGQVSGIRANINTGRVGIGVKF